MIAEAIHCTADRVYLSLGHALSQSVKAAHLSRNMGEPAAWCNIGARSSMLHHADQSAMAIVWYAIVGHRGDQCLFVACSLRVARWPELTISLPLRLIHSRGSLMHTYLFSGYVYVNRKKHEQKAF